jgi:hypothetical protein
MQNNENSFYMQYPPTCFGRSHPQGCLPENGCSQNVKEGNVYKNY